MQSDCDMNWPLTVASHTEERQPDGCKQSQPDVTQINEIYKVRRVGHRIQSEVQQSHVKQTLKPNVLQ